MTQHWPVIEEENVKIGEDNFDRSVPTIFDDVAGIYDLVEHKSRKNYLYVFVLFCILYNISSNLMSFFKCSMPIYVCL